MPPQPKSSNQLSPQSEAAPSAETTPSAGAAPATAAVLLRLRSRVRGAGERPTAVGAGTRHGVGRVPRRQVRDALRSQPSPRSIVARPILGSDSGAADATIEDGSVVLEIPASPDMTGTRAIAEITLRGIGAGRSSLSFEPVEIFGFSTTLSGVVVDVR